MSVWNTTINHGDMLRNLGIFERALFLSDQHAPFNVVSILRLEHAPVPKMIQHALSVLQSLHPLLQARIQDGKFVRISNPSLPFEIIEGQADTDWLGRAEQEMNTRLDTERGLFRGNYVYSAGRADLFLTFHHAIMDAASGMKLLDDLLRMCAAGPRAQKVVSPAALEVTPPAEERFPASFKGFPGLRKTMQYAAAQMADEIRYRWHRRGTRRPSVHLGARGFPLTLTISESLVDALSKRCRTKRVTLNSLLNAALLLVTNRLLYAGRLTPMRTFSFADLRSYTIPLTPAEHLANYMSMLRYTMDVSGETDIWAIAVDLHNKIYRSLKQGDKFSAVRMSESLIKMFVGMKSTRMGTTALNFSGAVPLKTRYGEIHVKGLHGFLSSFDLGPEVSAQSRLFDNKLWMDFMFLETDMDQDTAGKLLQEVKTVLERASRG